ncbi:hypothetical protein BFW38_00445 [Terasakiispira papahanaumokuakeensis]|uniref:AsmA domain-containing protein n=1 Tax=Terasakiispira papahanaumokuakeensis TaxID=197479 RepID=A0A1E2V5I5_9GAMM|nr:AsmA family protein [Terasakiispira papahanaumokuakeensis]ODC02238.1 hypothetical protein BFW38_00445 [Terasakiispira papahanaumokuakeensis]
MRRWLKWGLISVFSVVGIAIITVVALLLLVDPNSYKPQLKALAARQGLQLEMPGELSWSFYPRLGFNLGETSVTPLEGPETQNPLAAIDSAQVGLALIPLFSGQIQIDTLALVRPSIYLYRNAEGDSNWAHLTPSTETHATSEKETEAVTSEPTSSTQKPMSLAIDQLSIEQAQVKLDDQTSALTMGLQEFNLLAHNVSLNAPFPLEVSGRLKGQTGQGNQAMPVDVQWSLDTLIQVQLDAQHYQLQDLTFKVSAAQPKIAQGPLDLTIRGYLNADLGQDMIDLPITLTLANMSLPPDPSGHALGLDNTRLDLGLKFKPNAQQLDLNRFSLTGDLRSPTQAANSDMLPFSVSLNAKADLKAQQAQLQHFQGKLAELVLSGQGQISQWAEQAKGEANFSLKTDQLKTLLSQLGIALPERQDPETLKAMTLSLTAALGSQQLNIKPLKLTLDQTTFEGTAGYGLDDGQIRLNLSGDQLDADRYLPPPATNTTDSTPAEVPQDPNQPTAPMGKGPGNQAPLLPVETLRQLNLDIATQLQQLKIQGLTLNNNRLALTARDGNIQLTHADTDLYQGQWRAQGQIDARRDPLQLSFTQTLKQLDLAPLLKDLGHPDKLAGTLALNGEYKTRGNTLPDWKQHLNGQGKLNIDDGVLHGINISQTLCQAVARVQDRQSQRDWSEGTEFSNFSADVDIQDGRIKNEPLVMAIPGIEISGGGFFDLTLQDFLYNLGARFKPDAEQGVCTVTEALARVRWPLQCQGNLGEEGRISCGVDTRSIGDAVKTMAEEKAREKAAAELQRGQERLQEKVDENREKVKNKIDEELNRGLRHLFKKKEQQ